MGNELPSVRTGPREFRERVSDSILGHRDWVYLSKEETLGLPPQAWKGLTGDPSPDAVEAKRHRLSFYGGETLLELCGTGDSPPTGPRYFLESLGKLHPLEGGSAYVIPQDYDPGMKLNLTLENALDYLRFYFFFVHKKFGPVFLLDNLEHPALDHDRLDEFFAAELEDEVEPPVVQEGRPFWDFTCDAFFLYSDCVYKTTFILDHGIVDGTPDDAVAEGLPVHRLKADYTLGPKTLSRAYRREYPGGRPVRFLE